MRRTVGAKFGGVIILALLLIVGAGGGALLELRRLSVQTVQLAHAAQASQQAHKLRTEILALRVELHDGITLQNAEDLHQQIAGRMQAVEASLTTLDHALVERDEIILGPVVESIQGWLNAEVRHLLELIDQGDWYVAAASLTNQFEPMQRFIEAEIEQMDMALQHDVDIAMQAVAETRRSVIQRLLGITVGSLLLLSLAMGLLWRNLVTPIRRLTISATALARGNLGVRANIRPRSDEVGVLAHTFDTMADKLEESHRTLADKVAIRTAELEQERMHLATAVQQLNYLASHDPLTGLPNRRSLSEALEQTVTDADYGKVSTLLFLDLDHFKLVNDTRGHAAGDKVLVTVTQLLSQQLRDCDLLARLGGDEFAVLLNDLCPEKAWPIVERLRAAVDMFPFTVDGRSFKLSLSIGMVAIDAQQTAEQALMCADSALYVAKEQGRNRVVPYLPEMETSNELSDANQWAARIKDALCNERMLLYLQPVVQLDDTRIVHYEALIRLQDESGTIIPPSAFLPAAERFGLMPQIDRWVVRQALQILHHQPHIRLFINLSRDSLRDEALLADIQSEVLACGLVPNRLGFEITETAALADVAHAARWICRLKTLGCQFALDDFGVGISSFAHLQHVPVDQIKIDGSFIRNLDQDPLNRAIIQAIQILAHTLGKTTIAEFVENESTRRTLQALGIRYGQGYYFGKPVPALICRGERRITATSDYSSIEHASSSITHPVKQEQHPSTVASTA
jgi:diguanylate cyclase (GGDEF)-like protein